MLQREVKGQRGGKGNPEISTSRKPVVGTKGRGEVIGGQEWGLPGKPQEDPTWPLQEMSKAERLPSVFPSTDLQSLLDHTLQKWGEGGTMKRWETVLSLNRKMIRTKPP